MLKLGDPRMWCRHLCEDWRFLMLTTALTFGALLGDDLRLLATGSSPAVSRQVSRFWCCTRYELHRRSESQAAVGNFFSSLQSLILEAVFARTYHVRLYLCDSVELHLP